MNTALEPAAPNGAAALELSSVTKWFAGQAALRDVGLALRPGEVHALLGQNGSGKSTLIKILAGFQKPDGDARAWVHGRPLQLGSAAAAHAAGLRFVHQDLALVDDLDVVDNLALGERYAGRRWLSSRRERGAARAILKSLGVDIDPGRRVRDLTCAQRTMLAVARALRSSTHEDCVLVLDEVTAALPEGEAQVVLDLVRGIRGAGGTVLYVTHRLEEVFELADRVTVLRDGRHVATAALAGLRKADLVELIVGRPLEELYPPLPRPQQDVGLAAHAISGGAVRDVSVDLHRGEIVGVAGLAGSGREELPYLLFGAQRRASGQVNIDGQPLKRLTPARAIAAGLGLIPADRARRAATPSLTLRENVTLPRIRSRRWGWIGVDSEQRDVRDWLTRLEVSPAETEAPLATLSGGNQQKVVLARWLRCQPRILLLDEPTQGIDVGSKAAIYAQLAERARDGLAVLIASTDHQELAAICDRVLIVRDGLITAELAGAALTSHGITEQTLTPGQDHHPGALT